MHDDKEFYIENIIEQLELQGKKKKDLVDVLNVKPSAISKYLNGTRKLSINDLIKICNFLNITPNEILDFE